MTLLAFHHEYFPDRMSRSITGVHGFSFKIGTILGTIWGKHITAPARRKVDTGVGGRCVESSLFLRSCPTGGGGHGWVNPSNPPIKCYLSNLQHVGKLFSCSPISWGWPQCENSDLSQVLPQADIPWTDISGKRKPKTATLSTLPLSSRHTDYRSISSHLCRLSAHIGETVHVFRRMTDLSMPLGVL
jgi:hypothetical protein